MKEQIIQIPETLEIKESKDGKIILVEKEKKLTYKDITKKLFGVKTVYWINKFGVIESSDNVGDNYLSNTNNASTRKQLEKLLAINKLMNVAKYLNNNWQPDWSNLHEYKYYIYCNNNNILLISETISNHSANIYFKSEELAKQAIEILGEKTIKLALCTDY